MANSAQYAATAKLGAASTNVANTNRDGTGTLKQVTAATGTTGRRIDKLIAQAVGTTAQGKLRFFLTKGRPGATINSITAAATTVTVTTTTAHGMATGDKVTIENCFPDEFNVQDAAIVAVAANSFTYQLAAAAPTATATIGQYCSAAAAAPNYLWRELNVSAVATVDATTSPWSQGMATGNAVDSTYLPLVLPPGWALKFAPHNAEQFNVAASFMGDF